MTTYTDDFNRADNTDIATGGLAWVESSGNFVISSNTLQSRSDNSTAFATVNQDLGTETHSSKITIGSTSATHASSAAGPFCRKSGTSSTRTYYAARINGALTTLTIYRFVSGSGTLLKTQDVTSLSLSKPFDLKLTVSGTGATVTCIVDIDGTEYTVDDTSGSRLTTGNYAGVETFSNSNNYMTIDDYVADDSPVLDGDPPELGVAYINGASLTLRFDENVSGATSGANGITLDATGGAVTAEYSSGDGTPTRVYTLSRTPATNETITLDATSSDLDDDAGNSLEDITDRPVVFGGVVTSPAISTDGKKVSFTLGGMVAASITGFESGKSATLACIREGYSGTTLGTKSSTAIRTAFLSSTDSSGNALVTLTLEEPIHDDDTSVTITIDESAFSDGSITNTAASAMATTNSSTADYATPVCLIVSKHWSEKAVTTVPVDVFACGAAYAGHRENLGIEAVRVELCEAITTASSPGTFTVGETITGGTSGATCRLVKQSTTTLWITDVVGGPFTSSETLTGGTSAASATFSSGGRSVVKTATALSKIDRYGTKGFQAQWQAFHTEFDVSTSGGDWTGGPVDNQWLTVTAKAYPQVGDAASVRTAAETYVFADPDDDYDAKTAWVDSRGTITLTAGLTNDLDDGTDIAGATSAARAYLVGDHAMGTTSLKVSHIKGTFTADEDLNFDDVIASTTETKTMSGSPSWNASDGTGAVGSSGTPFFTPYKAAAACQTASSDGTASWSTIYLMGSSSHKGRVILGQYLFADKISTHHGPVIIAVDPGIDDAANAMVAGVRDNDGMRTHLVRIDADIEFMNGAQVSDDGFTEIKKNSATWDTGGIVGAGKRIALHGVTVRGKAPLVTMGSRSDWGQCGGHYGGEFNTVKNPRFNLGDGAVARDIKFSGAGGDCYRPDAQTNGNGHFNGDISLDNTGSGVHGDCYQFVGSASTDLFQNHAFCFHWVHDLVDQQCAPFANHDNTQSDQIKSFAMVGNIQESDGSSQLSQLDDTLLTDVFFYHNIWLDALLIRNDYTEINVWWVNNVLADWQATLTGSVQPSACGKIDNHDIVGTGVTVGFDRTMGSSLAALFEDTANDDYTPKAGSALLDRWAEPQMPFDVYGTAMPTDGSGAVGALQVGLPTATSVTIDSAGTEVTVVFSKAVESGADGWSGLVVGGEACTYSSGTGTDTIVFTCSAISSGTQTAAYTQPGDGIQDADGGLLATFSGMATTNNVQPSEGGVDTGGLVQAIARPLASPIGGTL